MSERRRLCTAMVLTAALCGGCVATGRPHSSQALLFDGLGAHHRDITTSSDLAQRYFDQGLIWAYAFNHDEAIRSFEQAARLDPDCAMAYWGIALCHGPHINNPVMPKERSEAAWAAWQKAAERMDRATPVERDLIQALQCRYAEPPPKDRKPLDEAYAAAMGKVYAAHPQDPDVAVLYAEALMDLQPWEMWTHEGAPKGRTLEVLKVLEAVMAMAPEHPGALHLYIHAVEASPQPQRAMAAADRLRDLVPASGHLVHMPSHIDVLTGGWERASEQNERAIAADRAYQARSPKQGFYRVYMAHNHHMLAYSSMMEGRGEAAHRAAVEMIAGVPDEFIRSDAALIDPFMSIEQAVLMRFGRWDDILRLQRPRSELPITTAMWHFARAVALAAKGEVRQAEAEQAAFRNAVNEVPDGALMSINPAERVLGIAEHMLAGELAYRRGGIDEAVRELREAIAREDALIYMEPPEWIQPVRHTLGAILVSQGRWSEAEEVYREDLRRRPENGWSLQGLARCLEARGAAAEAAETWNRFEKAWARADTPITTSCLCVKQ